MCGPATIRWFLSVDQGDLPPSSAGTTYRSITLGDEEIDLSNGLTDLHTRSYQEIVAGRGLGLRCVRHAIEIISAFRTAPMELRRGERHPFVQRHLLANPRHPVKGLSPVAPIVPEMDSPRT